MTRHKTLGGPESKRTPEEKQQAIVEIARLKNKFNLANNLIGVRLGLAVSTVGKYVREAKAQGLIDTQDSTGPD